MRMGSWWVAGGESIVRSYQEFLFWRFFFNSFPELDEISRRKYFFRFLLISVGLKIRYVWFGLAVWKEGYPKILKKDRLGESW